MSGQKTLRTLYPFEPDYLDRALQSLAGVPNYPFCEEHDRPLLAEIIRDFPDIDIIDQIKAWRWYRVDNPARLKNPRGALRRWMLRAREFGLQHLPASSTFHGAPGRAVALPSPTATSHATAPPPSVQRHWGDGTGTGSISAEQQTGEVPMRRSLHAVTLVLVVTLSIAVVSAAGKAPGGLPVPQPLRPWVEWVLDGHPDVGCPLVDGKRQCLWPGRMTLEVDERGGSFTLWVYADATADLTLPGGRTHWPRSVRDGDRPALTVWHGAVPTVRLEAGLHHLTGRFVWPHLPASLPFPNEIALLDLSIDGVPVQRLQRPGDGRVWLRAGRTRSAEEDRLRLTVSRRIDDGVPVALNTVIDLEVSGKEREVEIPAFLPAGFRPVELGGNLPLRLRSDGRLRVQLRPGRWTVHLKAASQGPVQEIACPRVGSPWPAEETWVFAAAPRVRSVQVSGAPGVDPKRTSLPEQWQKLPAWRIEPGLTLRFTELRRGVGPPRPDALEVRRELWLMTSGRRLVVRDRLTGTLGQGGRLSVLPPGSLGRATVEGLDQVITTGPDGSSGIEMRKTQVVLTAVVTYEGSLTVPAVGWDRDARSLSGRVHLPPGWKALAVVGADRAPGSWIGRWSLLDLFFLLLMASAGARLISPLWGAVALVGWGLAWQDPSTPVAAWLILLVTLALLRALPEGRSHRFIRLIHGIVMIVLAVQLLIFAAQELRTGLFPQLDWQGLTRGGFATLATREKEPAPDMTSREPVLNKITRINRSMISPSPGRTYGGQGPYSQKRRLVQAPPPDAVTQTGPGLPAWTWRTIDLKWSGPVEKSQEIRLLLISPGVSLILALLKVLAGLYLGFGLARVSWPAAPTGRAWLRRLGLAVLMAAAASHPAAAQGQQAKVAPTPAPGSLLDQLEARLTRLPPCRGHCVEIPSATITAQGGSLRLELAVHAATLTAVPLPTASGSWRPAIITLDGKPARALRRASNGRVLLRVGRGVHRVTLAGPLDRSITLHMPLPPRTLTFRGSGWRLEGLAADAPPPSSVRLLRLRGGRAVDPSVSSLEGLVPRLELTRTINLDVRWTVDNRLRRLGPTHEPLLLRVPLLQGESVTTPGIAVKDGQALIRLTSGERQRSWSGTLKETETLNLEAAADRGWFERWELLPSPLWSFEADGPPLVQHTDDGRWEPAWLPWPGEALRLRFNRPAPAPGATVAIDNVQVQLVPGRRLEDGTVDTTVRLSRGEKVVWTLPADSTLQSLNVDSEPFPARLAKGRLELPLQPGEHQISIHWRATRRAGFVHRFPRVTLSQPSANIALSLKVPQNRWLIWTGGPSWGPVLQFWQLAAVLLLAAFLLGRLAPTPLKPWDWFLLGLGLTQTGVAGAVLVALWLLVLGVRTRLETGRPWLYDLTQLALAFWTVAALAVLYLAVYRGLLLAPEMGVAGPGSSAASLLWFADAASGPLPRPYVVWLPLWVWRIVMLGWSLWLAWRLLRWLPWAWQQATGDGAWRSLFKRRNPVTEPGLVGDLPVEGGKDD
ncbi:MAG: hypothetical protein GXP47_13445 [Acidobacteria bacterium]|nr:hypothetical protein [Acidobacteriota bacterium]